MGSDVVDQQVGCLWQGDNILSVSLSGNINYLDPANPDKPRRIVKVLNSAGSLVLFVMLLKCRDIIRVFCLLCIFPRRTKSTLAVMMGELVCFQYTYTVSLCILSLTLIADGYFLYSALGYQWSRNG